MRQVFSSPRIANVEGIAKMLEADGIEVRITHGRSYKSGWSGRRTYKDSETGGPLPAVWVVRSEDQPRARQILREAGLLDSTRGGSDSFLPDAVLHVSERTTATPTKRAFRYKIGLLIAIVLAVALAWIAAHRAGKAPTAAAPTAKPAATAPVAVQTAPVDPVPGAYPVETPPALATMLAGVELAADAPKIACLQIDGAAASKDVTAALPASTQLDCTDTTGTKSLVIDVRGYRTDGSGTGTVELAVTSAGAQATQVRTLLVRRTENEWRVLRVLSVR
ncbi:Pathogenicity-related protein [Lysobacter dokdonensis DS-58]|uniref:Pathogenicity-related protein n=1 Tax=Lysobacter dokdonensis DS-58 TaxID=1300345 RepID=A0A0A2WLW8_9GAMM|nr:hypothetical protein [Lysobacter dokdonensis]KGQ19702.1 Pathogenicity-related protein [Lysobacter dokdonensis DS-58]